MYRSEAFSALVNTVESAGRGSPLLVAPSPSMTLKYPLSTVMVCCSAHRRVPALGSLQTRKITS